MVNVAVTHILHNDNDNVEYHTNMYLTCRLHIMTYSNFLCHGTFIHKYGDDITNFLNETICHGGLTRFIIYDWHSLHFDNLCLSTRYFTETYIDFQQVEEPFGTQAMHNVTY